MHTKVSAKAASSDGGQGYVRPELEVIPEDEFDEPTAAPAKPTTTEDKARALLHRMGIPQAWTLPAEKLAELVALIEMSRNR